MNLELQARSPYEGTSPEVLRRRMGLYVRQLLEFDPRFRELGWPLEVEWTASRLTATIIRGELRLSDYVMVRNWWLPQSKHQAIENATRLSGVLLGLHRQYAAADSTGRIRLPAWVSARGFVSLEADPEFEAVELLLEPGVRPGSENGGSLVTFARHGYHTTRTFFKAIEDGWLKLSRSP